MIYASVYTTPQKVLQQLGKATTAELSTSSDDYLLITDLCKRVSAYIEGITSRVFAPYTAEKQYYFRDIAENGQFKGNRGRGTLYLDADLLVTSAIEWDNVAVTPTYYRERGAVSNTLPYELIDFDIGGANLLWSGEFADYIAVSGVWGFHTNISQAFATSGQTMTINSSATTVTVSSASAFDVLSYLRVENELMQVTARNTTSQVLTLARGVNGYTASAHTSASIEQFTPVADIALLATRMVAYNYENRNGLGTVIQFNDGTTAIQGVEKFATDILAYQRNTRPVRI